MISHILFENFRGIKRIELSELSQITLISGKNNSGKSSILEGTFLLLDHAAPQSFVKIRNFRGLPLVFAPNILWEPLFYGLDTYNTLYISAQLDGVKNTVEYSRDDAFIPVENTGISHDGNQYDFSINSSYSLKFMFTSNTYNEKGHFVVNSTGIRRYINTNLENNYIKPLPRAQYINSSIISRSNEITEWFGALELQGKKQQVIEILKILDPLISDITTIAVKGQIQLYVKIGKKLLPLKLAGDGFNKLLYVVLAIIENPGSIILIDEIENGFHYSMYPKLWKVIATVAHENNSQVLATTHSYECIEGAIEGIEDANMQRDFCYYRIERVNEKNRAFRYSGNLLRTAVDSYMEVR